jgi:hypothetical protein
MSCYQLMQWGFHRHAKPIPQFHLTPLVPQKRGNSVRKVVETLDGTACICSGILLFVEEGSKRAMLWINRRGLFLRIVRARRAWSLIRLALCRHGVCGVYVSGINSI